MAQDSLGRPSFRILISLQSFSHGILLLPT